jgi:Sulfotransferase family
LSTAETKSGEAVQTKIFRVEAFRNPAIAEDRRRELEAAEAEPLDMSVAHVLGDARAQTMLDDFGPMDFVERLGRLLGEVADNENLWRFAKVNFRAACVKAAANRLRNRDFLKRNPGIEGVVVDRPIIVVGLPRSGTTHLENLVAADRRLRYLPVYLGSQSAQNPGELPGTDGLDPRWVRANAHWQRKKQNAIMAAMHEHSPDHACGENELQMPDFATYQWEWMAEVPGWRDYYLSHDQAPHYRYGRQMLQAIAYQFPSDRRWILKGNQHSEQLPALMQVYPDATIVQIHRDPLAILQSVLTMRGLSILAHQKQPDIATHVAYWIDRIERMLRAYIRDMSVVPQGQKLDLMFQDVINDDVGTAQKLLEFAGLPSTEPSAADMRSYMNLHPRGKDGRVVYDLAGDFNLDIGALRERFSFYTNLFSVRQEVRP